MSDRARHDLERLRDVVAGVLGLWFDETRLDALAEAAEARADALRLGSLGGYADRLAAGDAGEVRALAERITVGETYFFRNANDLRAFVGQVVPERMQARAVERRLRFLSAGCSSGEEPYTLAMLLQELPLEGWDVEVVGADVNPAALARAAAARYGAWSLRQTDEAQRARYFVQDGREHLVREEVRARVRFEERNLAAEDPAFWSPGAYDAVFCRNVLMYFDKDVARRVVARIAGALAPGGFLFLGHAETLRGLSGEFHLRHDHDTFYYQLREGAEQQPERAAAASRGRAGIAAAPVDLPPDVDWLEAIRRASARVERLTAPREAPPPAAPATPAERLARASELHAEERHADALAALGGGPLEDETDLDLLLLRAVILASSGDPKEAERTCARILQLDELSAEAHYVKALCREHAGDLPGATDHDRYAAYLDPSFAMPRLHLGLLARRAGDRDAARRELARALGLLAAEDGARLLLLGGGFGRAALLDLCRAELRACGGAA